MTLTVIIPSLGRSTLWSVLQVLTPSPQAHVIVVFDLESVPTGWREAFPSVEFLCTDMGTMGAAYARNVGLKQVRTDLVAFLGDDTVPEPDWIQNTLSWHQNHPKETDALLGAVLWPAPYTNEPFHQWLLSNAQFDFGALNQGKPTSFRHFYTSNISFKFSLVGQDEFSPAFTGWGFEDIEFGYRLTKKGLQIHYKQDHIVWHHHPQRLPHTLKNMRSAAVNAHTFESLHPDVSLVPTGFKRLFIHTLVRLLTYIPRRFLPQKLRWWRDVKTAWAMVLSQQ